MHPNAERVAAAARDAGLEVVLREFPEGTRTAEDAARAIGGVPPFGHPSTLPTAIDEDLLDHDEVLAAAGTPRDVFAIAPAALVRATGGTVAALRQG